MFAFLTDFGVWAGPMLSTYELLQKYDVPGPRYTSYPTVPIWSDAVNEQNYTKSLNAIKGTEPLSLYFHLPFCEKLCHFCGCMQVITKDHTRSKAYVDDLITEISLVCAELKNTQKHVSQIHFGGGTPNFISPDEISLIMAAIRENFTVLDDAEIAIEMHPRTSTKEFCERLQKEGFNRVSLGVQSFDENVQKLINRNQTYTMTKDMCDTLRDLGFTNFNFDLIYGLPGQTLETFSDTLEKTLTLSPNRLAVYSYAHVPWVRPVQRSFKDSDIPTPENKLKMYEMALNFFEKNDYAAIGMDHFARKSEDLYTALINKSIHRNFMGYTTKADAHQIGFGVSSISYVAGNYFQNLKKIQDYQGSIQDNKLATLRGFVLSGKDKIRRDLITEIMCHMHVDKKDFAAKHGIEFNNYFNDDLKLLSDFENEELLKHTEDQLSVTDRGQITLRNIAMCFDEYLEEIKKNARNPVFSRTV